MRVLFPYTKCKVVNKSLKKVKLESSKDLGDQLILAIPISVLTYLIIKYIPIIFFFFKGIICQSRGLLLYRTYLFKGKFFFLNYFCLLHLHLILCPLNTFTTISRLFSPMPFWRTMRDLAVRLIKLTFLKSTIKLPSQLINEVKISKSLCVL